MSLVTLFLPVNTLSTVFLISVLSKSRNLTFDISGEGNLPRVTILRPALRNKQGNPVLLFQRLLIGQSQQLPLVLKNEGSVPAKVGRLQRVTTPL